MLSFINIPARIVSLLESNVSPGEIAAGVCLGMFIGFTPLNGPMAILLFIFFFVFRLNRVATLLTVPLFKAAYLLGVSGVLEKLGGFLLIDARPLSGLWAKLTSLPVIAYLDLNNTLVMGGIAGSAVLSVPLYFIARRISSAAKSYYAARTKSPKVAKALSGFKIAGRINAALDIDSGVGLDVKGMRYALFSSIRSVKSGGLLKRINLVKVAVVVAALFAVQFGIGMAISPMAGSFIIDSMNKASGTRISAERVNVWPLTLSFSLKGLKVFDPKKADARIVKADEASFRISPIALLSKRLVLSSIVLDGAQVDLEGSPDGSYNIQGLGAASPGAPDRQPQIAPPDMKAAWKSVTEKKGLYGKIWDKIRSKFSKEGSEERRRKKAAKIVTSLPKGRTVRFMSGPGAYLFEIRKLKLNNAGINIRPSDGQAVQIGKATLVLERITFNPGSGTGIGLFSVSGDVLRGSVVAGRLHILFSQDDNSVKAEMDLRDVDLDAIRFIYADVLPVNVVKGTITVSSRTSIIDGSIDSRNSFTLTGHRLEPKDGSKLAFGIIPVGLIAEALNAIDPVSLKFTIGGTVDKPEVGGFQKSLMALVGPYIASTKGKVVKEGVQSAVNSLKALLKSKLEKAQ